jgi:hypothetical protein
MSPASESRPVSVPGSETARQAQRKQPEKKSGMGTMIFWFIAFLLILFASFRATFFE